MDYAIVISGLFFGVVASIIARHRGRGEIVWFIVGFVLHLFALVVLFLPPVSRPGVTKKCPQCAEIVKDEASVCRFCGRQLDLTDGVEVG